MSKGIYLAYSKAGTAFLAMKMQRLFTKLETPEDIALHNDILADVLAIINGEEKMFFRAIDQILFQKVDKESKKKRVLFKLAEEILHIGHGKGT